MKTEKLLLLGGGALALYYFFIFKPQKDIEGAFAGGAGAVSALGTGLGDWIAGITGAIGAAGTAGLTGLAGIPGAPGAPGISDATVKALIAGEVAKQAAITQWKAAGGTMAGRAFVMPAPVIVPSGMWGIEKSYGLTVQQPAITSLMGQISGGQKALATITTIQDITRLTAQKAQEVAIKAQAPGSTVIGHRTQGGIEIYTLKSPIGVISTVRV